MNILMVYERTAMPFEKLPRKGHSVNWPPCAGLPDAFFSDQKSQFGYILEGLGMENVIYILVVK
jgi:hypothetical protein